MNSPPPFPLTPLKGDRHTRRTQRTHELLLDTMYQLVLEKDYREITVQDLLDRSGVARSTFYAHFRDKEDLLVAGYEYIGLPRTRVCDISGHPRVVLDISAWLFAATERHAALTTSLFSGASREIVLAHLENILVIQVREHFRKQEIYTQGDLRSELAVRSFVGALLASWQWWIRHDYPCSAQEATEAFDSLLNNGTWPALVIMPEKPW
ncbi:MAG: TetR/AcrR family transcriptional regulator [Gammaproteobacteria bacterium]|nr:TetR/AcrR family transcriptional regulator [Gammaproteobacteria bacterium]